MKVKKNTLLLLVCLIWLVAGFNVLKIGLTTYPGYATVINVILSIVVFCVFQKFIFGKLVNKHSTRINSYSDEEKYFFLMFFDVKSFIIIAVIMAGGILIRKFNLLPDWIIAFFYTGLGASLFLAGLLFGYNFLKTIGLVKRETFMKRYVNYSIIYALLAMAGGVFYLEFTKFDGFTGKTNLGVVHTHYFLLGMVFFLIMLLGEKSFKFSNDKVNKTLIAYHVGLNLTAIMLHGNSQTYLRAYQLLYQVLRVLVISS